MNAAAPPALVTVSPPGTTASAEQPSVTGTSTDGALTPQAFTARSRV